MTWTALFEGSNALESLGILWTKGKDCGIVQVIGTLELRYTHSNPASMRTILTKAALSGIGVNSNQLVISFGSST